VDPPLPPAQPPPLAPGPQHLAAVSRLMVGVRGRLRTLGWAMARVPCRCRHRREIRADRSREVHMDVGWFHSLSSCRAVLGGGGELVVSRGVQHGGAGAGGGSVGSSGVQHGGAGAGGGSVGSSGVQHGGAAEDGDGCLL
jgi:hypothetical protein